MNPVILKRRWIKLILHVPRIPRATQESTVPTLTLRLKRRIEPPYREIHVGARLQTASMVSSWLMSDQRHTYAIDVEESLLRGTIESFGDREIELRIAGDVAW